MNKTTFNKGIGVVLILSAIALLFLKASKIPDLQQSLQSWALNGDALLMFIGLLTLDHNTCLVMDELEFEPRVGFMGRFLKPVYLWVFKHRHNRLAKKYGSEASRLNWVNNGQ